MTTTNKTMRAGDEVTVNGRAARILAVDSDPTCYVWIVFEGTDEDAFVPRSEVR